MAFSIPYKGEGRGNELKKFESLKEETKLFQSPIRGKVDEERERKFIQPEVRRFNPL